MKIQTKITRSSFLLLFLFVSCDFTTSIHRDILKAQEYFQEKNYEEAIRYYKSVTDKRIDKDLKIKVFYQLAEIYLNYKEDYQASLSYYQKILTYDPTLVWQVKVYEKMGEIFLDHLDKFDEAIENYEKLYSFQPPLEKNDFYYFRVGMGYFKAKKYKRALRVFEDIGKQTQHSYFLQAQYQQGLIHFYKQEWQLAVDKWEKYLNFEKDTQKIVNAKFLIANAYEMLEELKTAYNIYFSILSDYPNPKVVEKRLKSLYERRVSRKR